MQWFSNGNTKGKIISFTLVSTPKSIPFVNKFTLLGEVFDDYLTFDLHTISLCSKVNWKISLLKKSSYSNFHFLNDNLFSFQSRIVDKLLQFVHGIKVNCNASFGLKKIHGILIGWKSLVKSCRILSRNVKDWCELF